MNDSHSLQQDFIVIGRICDCEEYYIPVTASSTEDAKKKAIQKLINNAVDYDPDNDIYIDFVITKNLEVTETTLSLLV